MNETPRKNEINNVTDSQTSGSKQKASSSESVTGGELEKLSAYLPELSKCISQHDIYRFRELASLLRQSLEKLELTDLSKKLQQLNTKCVTAQDLVLNEIEIQELIKELVNISTMSGQTGKHDKAS
jgi:hypothetical protein